LQHNKNADQLTIENSKIIPTKTAINPFILSTLINREISRSLNREITNCNSGIYFKVYQLCLFTKLLPRQLGLQFQENAIEKLNSSRCD